MHTVPFLRLDGKLNTLTGAHLQKREAWAHGRERATFYLMRALKLRTNKACMVSKIFPKQSIFAKKGARAFSFLGGCEGEGRAGIKVCSSLEYRVDNLWT